jgi:hypothetical protein
MPRRRRGPWPGPVVRRAAPRPHGPPRIAGADKKRAVDLAGARAGVARSVASPPRRWLPSRTRRVAPLLAGFGDLRAPAELALERAHAGRMLGINAREQVVEGGESLWSRVSGRHVLAAPPSGWWGRFLENGPERSSALLVLAGVGRHSPLAAAPRSAITKPGRRSILHPPARGREAPRRLGRAGRADPPVGAGPMPRRGRGAGTPPDGCAVALLSRSTGRPADNDRRGTRGPTRGHCPA